MEDINRNKERGRWLKETEAAEICGLSVHTLRAQRQKSRGIPYAKIGRSVRYKLDDIIQFMQVHTVKPAMIRG